MCSSEAIKGFYDLYSFLYEYEHFNDRYSNGELLKYCTKLQTALTHNGQCDIDANELCNELRIVGEIMKDFKIKHPIEILNRIAEKG